MPNPEQTRTSRVAVVDSGLALTFALGIGTTAYMLATSWGGTSWVLMSVVSMAVAVCALLRERKPLLMAAAGLAVTAAAVWLAADRELPQEPAPTTALAAAVLIGSGIRRLAVGPALLVVAGGVGVVVLSWREGLSGVAVFATMVCVVALVVGAVLRVVAPVRPATDPGSMLGG